MTEACIRSGRLVTRRSGRANTVTNPEILKYDALPQGLNHKILEGSSGSLGSFVFYRFILVCVKIIL